MSAIEISHDPARLDVALIHDYLSGQSYWAPQRWMERLNPNVYARPA